MVQEVVTQYDPALQIRNSRIAFDLHGVLDTYAYFRKLANQAYNDPDTQMIIVTGSLYTLKLQRKLSDLKIKFDEFYSITQHILDKDPALIHWIDGHPFAEDEVWDTAKADICRAVNIDLLFDDSPIYGKYFQNHPTLYIEVQNGKWKDSGRHV